jgi:hypothetical protein
MEKRDVAAALIGAEVGAALGLVAVGGAFRAPIGVAPVSYTHMKLPTKREVYI